MNDFSKKPEKGEYSKIIKVVAPYLNLGMNMVATILMGAGLGWWLDKTLNTKPVLLIVLTFLFSIVAMVNLIRTALNSNSKNK
jgi:ATP synthase protein I